MGSNRQKAYYYDNGRKDGDERGVALGCATSLELLHVSYSFVAYFN